MVISHNMMAQEAQRYYKINGKNKEKTAEKLSSGYRINRSADDAAGLAISEKMRSLIRGLDRGTDNIQEGISLIQTADGALAEVTDILQRVNELTIQAYNGTNSKADRECCQEEINELFTEIERIAETTTFNELHLFQDNQGGRATEIVRVVVSDAYEETRMVPHTMTEKRIPDWLYVDDRLEKHDYSGIQDVTGVMPWDEDGNHNYYGPENSTSPKAAAREWKGGWSETLSDNATAKIDFSGLVDKSPTLEELYKNLAYLIGSSIGIPCGTCTSTFYGISFTGQLPSFSAAAKSYPGYGRLPSAVLDLTAQKMINVGDESYTCFEYIDKLQQELQENPDLDAEDIARGAADVIAKALCSTSYSLMGQDFEAKDHYDRSIQPDDYSIIVYDFRDQDLISDPDADVTVQKTAVSEFLVKETYTVPEVVEYREVDRWRGQGLSIVCSSEGAKDSIPIWLREISLKKLGLLDYTVVKYAWRGENVYTESEEDYRKRREEWESTGTYVTWTEQTTKTVSDIVDYAFNRDGELEPVFGEPYEKTFTVEHSKKEYPTPEPVRRSVTIGEVVYDPSDVQIISDALQYVCWIRSDLGAIQNRLEHAYDNNNNKHENTTAAESRIRDTDMVEGVVENSKNSILQQVGEAIMAQANQNQQNIIQLLA